MRTPAGLPGALVPLAAYLLFARKLAAQAIVLEVPLEVPQLHGWSADLPAGDGASIAIDLVLAYDEAGRIVRGGECTVDGAAVSVKGSIKSKGGALGYTLSLKGVAERISVKIQGGIGAPQEEGAFQVLADIAYKGPKGSASAAGAQATIHASPVVAVVTLDPLGGAGKGAITGSAAIESGYGNDSTIPGAIKGSIKSASASETLTLSIQHGKQKVSFKGTRAGDAFVGPIQYRIAPAKGTISSYEVPAIEVSAPAGLGGLVINEIMASNHATLEDSGEPGTYPDWIEIYNGTGKSVDLRGMHVTDDLQRLDKWRIASRTVLAPGAYLLLWADDDGKQGPDHTNFNLSAAGERLALVDRDGRTIVDSMTFGPQPRDVSYGRYPDGTGPWGFHERPTPRAANRPHSR